MRLAGITPAAIMTTILCGILAASLHAQPPNQAVPGVHGWVTPAVTAVGTQQVVFRSEAAGMAVSYHVFTPPQYDTEPERRFPVLYWLHGGGGVPPTGGVAPIAAHFDAAIRAGNIPPLLVVFPNGLDWSLWVDSVDGSVPMETVMVKELVPHVDATFRTVPSREGRMVEGFSMGGYGAARFGLKFHALFCAASSFAGGPLHPNFGESPRVGPRTRRTTLAVFGDDVAQYVAAHPWTLAAENADVVRGRLHLRVVVGALDESAGLSREFSRHLERLEIPHIYAEIPGVGHTALPLFRALGGDNWAFYHRALGGDGDAAPGD